MFSPKIANFSQPVLKVDLSSVLEPNLFYSIDTIHE